MVLIILSGQPIGTYTPKSTEVRGSYCNETMSIHSKIIVFTDMFIYIMSIRKALGNSKSER